MLTYLPWIALVIALAAIFARDGVKTEKPVKREAPAGAFIVLALIVGGAMLAGWIWNSTYDGLFPAMLGFSVGALLAAVSYGVGLLPGQETAGRAAPLALAITTVLALRWLPNGTDLPLVFGAAVAAWLLSIGKQEEPNPWAMRAAIAAALVVACNRLGGLAGLGDNGHQAGALFGLIIAIAAVLAGPVVGLVTKKNPSESPFGMFVAGLAIFAIGSFLVGDKLLGEQDYYVLFISAAIAAGIVAWLIPEQAPASTVRLLVAVVIWLALGIAAFGFQQGFGMSIALMGGAGMLMLLAHPRALLSIGPLAAIVLFRVFGEIHEGAPKAIDIGQHYAMIAVVIGALLPVIAQEWLRATGKRGPTALFAGILWVPLLIIGPVAAAVLLGGKGVVGYLVGLGLAPVLEGVRGERSAHSLSLGLGLAAAMIVTYNWITPYLDLTREDKLTTMAWLGGGILVAAILIVLLGGVPQPEESKEQVS